MGLFERKIKEFSKIREWAVTSDVSSLTHFLLDRDIPNRFFLASGGSYSAAAFAELLSIENGMMAKALTPLVYSGCPYNQLEGKTLLLSASGNNNDIRRAYESCLAGKRQTAGALVLARKGYLQSTMPEQGNFTLIHELPTGKDGFLSTATVFAFYLLLYKAYGHTNTEDIELELKGEEQSELDAFIALLKDIPEDDMSHQEAFLQKLEGVDSFYVLYGAKSYPVALDIESKCSEGALGNIQVSDYRNFAHGRFNWFTQRPGQTGLICLQHPDELNLSEEILSMLPNYVPVLRLRTDKTDLSGCIELLVKAHYLCSALGKRWGLDISRPTVPEYGRILYRQ